MDNSHDLFMVIAVIFGKIVFELHAHSVHLVSTCFHEEVLVILPEVSNGRIISPEKRILAQHEFHIAHL